MEQAISRSAFAEAANRRLGTDDSSLLPAAALAEPQAKPAGPLTPVTASLIAVRKLLEALRLAMLMRSRQYAAACAAVCHNVTGMDWTFIVQYSREAAFEVRDTHLLYLSTASTT